MKVTALLLRGLRLSWEFLQETVSNLTEDEGLRIAAEASFYLIFSVFPLLFLILVALSWIGITGLESSFSYDFTERVRDLIPAGTLELVQKQLTNMRSLHPGRDIAISLVLFIWPASTVFYAYIDAVSRAYHAPRISYLRTRLLSFGLLFISGFLFILAFMVLSFAPLLLRFLDYLGIHSLLIDLLGLSRFLAVFVLITPSIGLVYYYGPRTSERNELYIWPGAFLATVLWILSSHLFGMYIYHFDTYQALYGTLGGAMLLLMWMYLTSVSLILGAEFNQTIRKRSEPPSSESI